MAKLEEIRKRLEQQADERGPLRKLTVTEETRRRRLERLLANIDINKDVSRRDLKTALTDDEWAVYEQMGEQESARKELEKRPKEFDRYIEMLKLADFYHNRAENTKTTRRSRRDIRGRAGALRLYDKAESVYEDAIEHLEELIMGADRVKRGDLLTWLDRPVEFTAGADIGPDPISVPRVLGSKSIHARSSLTLHNVFEIRRCNKREALQGALNSLIYEDIGIANGDDGSKKSVKLEALMNNYGNADEF